MILELMPGRAETYHVFLKTIACYSTIHAALEKKFFFGLTMLEKQSPCCIRAHFSFFITCSTPGPLLRYCAACTV